MTQIIDRMQTLQEIFREELDDDMIMLTPELSADDVEAWDSLANIRIIAAVEREFGMFEIHSLNQADVLESGRIVLERLGLKKEVTFHFPLKKLLEKLKLIFLTLTLIQVEMIF